MKGRDRIARATVHAVQGPSTGARNALKSWDERRALVLTLEDRTGTWGRGEASPLPGYTPDDLPLVERALSTIDWATVGPIPPPHEAIAWIQGVLDAMPPEAPAASCAVEAALLELLSRRARIPVLELLGQTKRDVVPLAHLVHVQEGTEALRSAEALVAAGWRTLKVKVGRSGGFDREIAFLRSLREQVGCDVRLRIDANQGLGGPGLRDRLIALTELRPELIEEPAPAVEMKAFADGPWRIGLDESLFLDAEGVIAARAGPGTYVVLKPMALGGILRCLSLARAAERLGARVVVTHTLDGPIGWCVASILALLVQDADVAAGLAPHPGLRAWPQQELPGLEGPYLRGTRFVGWGPGWKT